MPKKTRQSTTLHQRLAKRLDRQLLTLITNGRAAFNQNGEPILDAQGRQVMKPPTAADLAVIRGAAHLSTRRIAVSLNGPTPH